MKGPSWKKKVTRYVQTESGWLCVRPWSHRYAAFYWVTDDGKVRMSFSRLTLNQMLALQAALQASIEAYMEKEEENASST